MKEKETVAMEPLEKKSGLIAKFEARGSLILKAAESLAVVDESSRAKAAEMRESARQVVKEIEAEFSDDREKAHGLWKAIVARIKKMTNFPEQVIAVCDRKMNAYLLEEDRKRRIEDERLRKIAEAEAEKERQKLLKAAAKAEEKGNAEKAEEKRAEAEMVQAYVPVAQGPDKSIKTSSGGTSASKDFSIDVLDPMAVIRAVAAGALPPAVLEIKLGALKKAAEMKRIGDALPVMPGCRLTPKFNFAGRAHQG